MCPNLPPPSECVSSSDFAKKKDYPALHRPHCTNLLHPNITLEETGYNSYVGWTGSTFGGYSGASFWVDGLNAFGVKAGMSKRYGDKIGRGSYSWSTLTMTVDFCGTFQPRELNDAYTLKDGTELYIASEKLMWLSGNTDDGRVGEEVELWDPVTRTPVCRTKQIGLVSWVPIKEQKL